MKTKRRQGRALLLLLLGCGFFMLAGLGQTALGQGRPVFDNKGNGCNFDGALSPRTFSWAHTLGGGQHRLLLVSVSTALDISPIGGLLPPRVAQVVLKTENGDLELTRIDDFSAVSSPETNAAVEMFRLAEPLPPAGSYTIEVTLFGGVDYAVGGSVSLSQVNQTRPTGSFQRNGGNSRAPSISVKGAPNQLLLDTVATRYDAGALQVATSLLERTARWNGRICFDQLHSIGAGSTAQGLAFIKQGPLFTTTLNWTMVGGNNLSQPWAIGAVSVRPVPTKPSDFDGDGRTDAAVWRKSSGNWYVNSSSAGPRVQFDWGREALNDIAAPGDYDDDLKADIAIFRPSEGNWYIIQSLTNTVVNRNWGQNGDVPVPADFDGDGKTDLAVFRPTEGNWYILNSFDNTARVQGWGNSTDRLVPGDYDGDDLADIAVWRPTDGNWYILRSSDGTGSVQNWGIGGDQPVPGDYDGDGRTDMAVFRPTEGNWYIRRSSGGAMIRNWGSSSDQPVPGDYDGDDKTDFAVFRPSEGNWYILQSSTGGAVVQFLGQGGDVAVPAAYPH